VRSSASVVPPRYLLSEVVAAPRKVAAVPLQQADLLRDVPARGSVYVYDLGHAIRKEDGIEVLRVWRGWSARYSVGGMMEVLRGGSGRVVAVQ
jgi:hypothetical protein